MLGYSQNFQVWCTVILHIFWVLDIGVQNGLNNTTCFSFTDKFHHLFSPTKIKFVWLSYLAKTYENSWYHALTPKRSIAFQIENAIFFFFLVTFRSHSLKNTYKRFGTILFKVFVFNLHSWPKLNCRIYSFVPDHHHSSRNIFCNRFLWKKGVVL